MLSSLLREVWGVTISRQDQPPHPLPPVQRGDGGEDRDGGGEAALRRLHGQLLHQDALLEQCPSHWEGVVPSGLSQDSYGYVSKYYLYYLHPYLRELWQGRTNSTVLLKQPNSLEVDRAELRKTKSAEHMGLLAPTIIIGQLSSWNLELPHDCIYRQGLALRHSDCYLRKQLGARKSLEVSQTCRGKIQNKYFYVTLWRGRGECVKGNIISILSAARIQNNF